MKAFFLEVIEKLTWVWGWITGRWNICLQHDAIYSKAMPACLFCAPAKTIPDPGPKNIYWPCKRCGAEFVTASDTLTEHNLCIICLTKEKSK